FKHMTAVARLAQLVYRAACNDFAPVTQKILYKLLEIEQAGLTVDQRHQVHPEGVLQLRVLIQVVQDDFGYLAALELDDQAHAVLVGLVANIRNALDLSFVDQFGDAFLQGLLVDLIGKLVNDNRLAIALFGVFKMRLGTHDDASASGAVAFAHPGHAINNAARGKVRRRDELDELVDRALGMAQAIQTAVYHFGQI